MFVVSWGGTPELQELACKCLLNLSISSSMIPVALQFYWPVECLNCSKQRVSHTQHAHEPDILARSGALLLGISFKKKASFFLHYCKHAGSAHYMVKSQGVASIS